MIESAFQKLLSGDLTVSLDTLSLLGVSLISQKMCIVFAKSKEDNTRELLENYFKESLVFSFSSEYEKAFILNIKDSHSSYYQDCYNTIKEDSLIESFSISLVHEGLASLRDCYLEAISVHEYQKEHEIKCLSYEELLSRTRQNTYQFTLEENMQLQRSLKDGDSDKAKFIINKVIDRNKENGVSPKTLRFLLSSISGTIIRTINSLDDRYSEVVPEMNFPPILRSPNFQRSLSGVEEIIDATCYAICEVNASQADASSESYQIYKKALSYIAENYGDNMMNVSSIADHLGLSIAYLSRIFKKYHGINISEQLTSYRLEKAKELLSKGSTVSTVVKECGFGSLRTFLRVFKAIEGVTPGQYKVSVSKES